MKIRMLSGTVVTFMLIVMNACHVPEQGAKDVQMLENAQEELQLPAGAVKKLVDENAFIDVEVESLVSSLQNAEATGSRVSAENQEEVVKMKAALYRFFSRVKVENGQYVTDLASPEEINVSRGLYDALMNNLTEMNEFLAKAKENGEEAQIGEVTEEYLNSLLD